jgi:CheY-like chemotaxis protein
VIDDEEPVRLTVRQTLELAGHTVVEADNGLAGMDMFNEHNPDLVVTDIIMPEQEGIATIAQLRQARPDLPIIAMSGGGRTGNVNFLQMASELGAEYVLDKPFHIDDLTAMVKKALAG